MSTLHELRATLEEHSEGIHDTEHAARVAAVHQQVRVVRRRRAASVAVAAVVAVVASVVAVDALRAPDDVVPTEQLHGVEVPTRVELVAGTYELDELRDVRPGKVIDFPYPEEVQRRAFALVGAGLGDGSATLLVNGNPWARLVGDRELSPAFAVFPFQLEVELEGAPAGAQVGIAVYDGPDTLFPERLGTEELVASATSDDSSAETTVTAPLSELALAPLCSSTAGEITVTVDGEVVLDEPCSQSLMAEDGSFSTTGGLGEDDEDEEHTIRVERTEPGVSIGAYVLGDGPEVLGRQVSDTVEWAGRTWVLEDVIEQDEPASSFTTSITTDEDDRLVDFVSTGFARAKFTSGLGEPCRAFSTDGVSDFCNPVLLAGDTHGIVVTGRSGFEAAVLVYRPL